MTRVVSKNLFNFAPAGALDEEVKAIEAQMEQMAKASPEAKQVMDRIKELETKDDQESNMEWIALFRSSMMLSIKALNNMPALNYGGEQTTTTFLKVPTKVFVSKTKFLAFFMIFTLFEKLNSS